MRRLLTALVVAGLAGFGLVAVTAGVAQAAPSSTAQVTQEDNCLTPPKVESTDAPTLKVLSFGHHEASRPCRQVDVVDNCDGTVTVTVKNTGDADAKEVKFRVNGKTSDWLGGGESQTFTIDAKDADEVQVDSLFRHYENWVTLVEHSWEWNASCLEVTAVSNCDNTFKVSVHNTSTAPGEFTWSLGLEDTKTTPIEAGATLSENFTKGQVVQIRVGKDGDLVKTLEFVQSKDCVTTAPSTSPAPAGGNGTPDLPVTGAALTGTLYTGGGLVLLAGAIIGFLVWRRRHEESKSAGLSIHD